MIRRKFLEELPRELAKAKRFPWCILKRVDVDIHTRFVILHYLNEMRKEYVINDIPPEWDALRRALRTKEREAVELFPTDADADLSRRERTYNKEYLRILIPLLRYFSE